MWFSQNCSPEVCLGIEKSCLWMDKVTVCSRIEDIDGPSNLLYLRSLVLLPLGRCCTWLYFRPELVILRWVLKVKRGREIERSLLRLSKTGGSEPFVCMCRMRELWGSLGREDMEKVLPRVDSSVWECCKCQMLHSSFPLFSLLHLKIIFRIFEQCIFLVFFSFLPSPSRSFPPPYPPTQFHLLSLKNKRW